MIGDQLNVINIAIKKLKKMEARIPFKNNFEGLLTLESEWIDDGLEQPLLCISNPSL